MVDRKTRLFLEKERQAAQLYILDNCEEVIPFATKCREEISLQNPTTNEDNVIDIYKKTLAGWFKCHLREVDQHPQINLLKCLSYGPHNMIRSYGSCYVNEYRFQTIDASSELSTQNCGIMVRGSC